MLFYAKLNEKGKENIDQICEASLQLNQIKELKVLKGGPVIRSDRSRVDDSFDLGFIMTFNSMDDMNAYYHPIHKAFVISTTWVPMQSVILCMTLKIFFI